MAGRLRVGALVEAQEASGHLARAVYILLIINARALFGRRVPGATS